MADTETATDGALVELEIADGIALVALNRPEVLNAIDDGLRAALIETLDRVAGDETVRAIVLTGRGRAFCAGGDISAMRERLNAPPGRVAANGWRRQRRIHHAVTLLHDMPKPTVAAVNGPAAGLGCDLALCCDFIVASDAASFVMSYVLRGLIPDGGGLYFLPRRVGLPRAKEMIYSGRRVDASEAGEIGLADRVVPADRLIGEATALARSMTEGAPTALALSKSILDRTFELPAEEAFALGAQAQAICYTTDEHREAVNAFLDRGKR